MTESHSSSRFSRREFATIVSGVVGTLMGALIGIPIIGYFVAPAFRKGGGEAWVSLGPVDGYPIGEPKAFTFARTQKNGWETSSKSYGVFVLRDDEKKLTVYSNVCTHLGCRVNWSVDEEAYLCPCHDAQFDLHGEVLYGPPPEPMETFEHEVDAEGNIQILVEG